MTVLANDWIWGVVENQFMASLLVYSGPGFKTGVLSGHM